MHYASAYNENSFPNSFPAINGRDLGLIGEINLLSLATMAGPGAFFDGTKLRGPAQLHIGAFIGHVRGKICVMSARRVNTINTDRVGQQEKQ